MKKERLYRLTKSGKPEMYWIEFDQGHETYSPSYGVYKCLVENEDEDRTAKTSIIKTGANKGKKNEITAFEKMLNIINKKYKDKQKKDGWLRWEDIPNSNTASENNWTLNLKIEFLINNLPKILTTKSGNKLPMLATSRYELKTGKETLKPNWPMFAQPKLNGVRSTSGLELCKEDAGTLFESESNTVIFRSRTDKIYEVKQLRYRMMELFNHINVDLDGYLFGYKNIPNRTLLKKDLRFDGEIYYHGWELESIISALPSKSNKNHELQYWIYDLAIPNIPQEQRLLLKDELILSSLKGEKLHFANNVGSIIQNIVNVNSVIVDKNTIAITLLNTYTSMDFEGIIYRHPQAFYQFGKRSKDLIKEKLSLDAEYEIIDIKPSNKDNFNGEDIGQYVCKLENGETFDVTPALSKAERYELLKHKNKYIGQMLTCKYYEHTKTGKPRSAVGIAIRNYE